MWIGTGIALFLAGLASGTLGMATRWHVLSLALITSGMLCVYVGLLLRA